MGVISGVVEYASFCEECPCTMSSYCQVNPPQATPVNVLVYKCRNYSVEVRTPSSQYEHKICMEKTQLARRGGKVKFWRLGNTRCYVLPPCDADIQ